MRGRMRSSTLAHGLGKGLPPERAHPSSRSAPRPPTSTGRNREATCGRRSTAPRVVLDDPWDRAVTADVRAFTLAQLGIAEFWAGNADSAADHLTAGRRAGGGLRQRSRAARRARRTEPRRTCGAGNPVRRPRTADARLSISRSSVGGRACPRRRWPTSRSRSCISGGTSWRRPSSSPTGRSLA